MKIVNEYYELDTPGEYNDTSGWTKDWGGTLEFDPCVIRLSSRVYSDGSVACSLYSGDTEIFTLPQTNHETVERAKAWVVEWSRMQAVLIQGAVKSLYDTPHLPPVPMECATLAAYEPPVTTHDHYAAAALIGILAGRQGVYHAAVKDAHAMGAEMVAARPQTQSGDTGMSIVEEAFQVRVPSTLEALSRALVNFHVSPEYEGYPGEAERLAIHFGELLAKHGMAVTEVAALHPEGNVYMHGYQQGFAAMRKVAADTVRNTGVEYIGLHTGMILERVMNEIQALGEQDMEE